MNLVVFVLECGNQLLPFLECGNLLLLFFSSMFTEYRGNYCKEDNYPFLAFKIGNWIFLKIYIFIYFEHSLKKFSCSNQAKNIPIILPCSQIKVEANRFNGAFKSDFCIFDPSKEHSSEFPHQYLRHIGRRAYNL